MNVARLPIGGRSTGDGAAQCIKISWLADIPKGVSRISIAGTAFTPPGIFKTGGKGCGNQQPLCREFTPQHTDCLLPVVQVKDVDTTVVLTLSGTATCVDKASCAYFAQNTEPGSIDLQAQSGVVGPPTTTTTTGKKNAPNSGPGS